MILVNFLLVQKYLILR